MYGNSVNMVINADGDFAHINNTFVVMVCVYAGNVIMAVLLEGMCVNSKKYRRQRGKVFSAMTRDDDDVNSVIDDEGMGMFIIGEGKVIEWEKTE